MAEGAIKMKRKIIAIVISVVIVAGTGTAVGIVVKQNNDAKTEELVSMAVSEALATTETTTKNSTSESAATENTATTESTTTEPSAKSATKPTAKTTTKGKSRVTSKTTVKEISTTNAPTEIDPDDIPEVVRTPIGTVVKIPKNREKDKYGYFWSTSYTYDSDLNPHSYTYCIDENNQIFYHDDDGNRVYYKGEE